MSDAAREAFEGYMPHGWRIGVDGKYVTRAVENRWCAFKTAWDIQQKIIDTLQFGVEELTASGNLKHKLHPAKILRLPPEFNMLAFTLSDAATRDAVVQALISKHGLSICGYKNMYFVWDEKNEVHLEGVHSSYKEALIAACLKRSIKP